MSGNQPTTRKVHEQIKIGDRFGRLKVIGGPIVISTPTVRHPGRKDIRFRCQCDCGAESVPSIYNLRSGGSRSCGCLKREASTRRLVAFNFRHGGKHLPEYESWIGMMKRCYNEKCKGYPNYGGRGISVCKRWKRSFQAFLADMGPRPSSGHSLDRKNNEGDYKPSNCRWATREQQNENRRSSVMLEFNGQCMLIKAWSRLTGIGKTTLSWRIRKGWTAEEALTTPPRCNRKDQNERTRST